MLGKRDEESNKLKQWQVNVVYVFVLIVENRMNVKYVTNVIHVPKTVQKANVLVGHLKSNLAFRRGDGAWRTM